MQFHLNGFRPGDPEVFEAAEAESRHTPDRLPDTVDVLIIGSGPAGLTLAAQLAIFPDITVRLIEQKSGPMLLGQADGIACRTMEMFHAFGFSEKVVKEAYWVNETVFWKPDAERPEHIARSSRIQDVEDGLSEFPHVILNQARVHDFFLDIMRNAPSRLEPDYDHRLIDLRIDTDAPDQAHAVTATIGWTDPDRDGDMDTIKARYVVGCDGARSTVRQSLGRPLHGDSANQAWGVMDVLAVTDFPDIRFKSVIHSTNEGNMLIIPREGGYMVRFYIELDKLADNERVANRNITTDHLIAAAQRIMQPYTVEVKEIAWWSVYEIGQRLCDRFDDASDHADDSRSPRVFITGDACHTHSPKAGQGMNVSVNDSFNLGWKLAAVLKGQATPDILHTYSVERQAVAKELIDFDREFAKMFSAPPKTAEEDNENSVDPAAFQDYFQRYGRFTAGTETHYKPSLITGTSDHQHLATGLVIGKRFHSAPVIRLADAKPMQLGHTVKADGRWHLFAFAGAGDIGAETGGIGALCESLEHAPNSPVRIHTPQGADRDSVIDVRAIFPPYHRDLAIQAMPPFLLPKKGRYGLHDYEKIFCADHKSGDDIFDIRGIDRKAGCMVIVRPDQYVAHILPLDAYDDLADFFARFMVPADAVRDMKRPAGEAPQVESAIATPTLWG